MSIISEARKWIGTVEGGAMHRQIIDNYNNGPRPSGGYMMTYSDPWCAAFVSLCAYDAGLAGFPFSVNCEEMRGRLAGRGRITYYPAVGGLVFFDWNGDCVCDHVGIVSKVSGGYFYSIEGNSSDSVRENCYPIGYNSVACFVELDNVDEPTEEPKKTKKPKDMKKGSKGPEVSILQAALVMLGYDVGRYGIDGEFGGDTLKALNAYKKDNEQQADGVCTVEELQKITEAIFSD